MGSQNIFGKDVAALSSPDKLDKHSETAKIAIKTPDLRGRHESCGSMISGAKGQALYGTGEDDARGKH